MTRRGAEDKNGGMDPLALAFDRWRTNGDLVALGAVFDALAPRLLPVALHLCGHAADAEDALQQTFLLAMDRAAGFDATQRLEPWLAGVLQNVVRNQARSLQRRRGEALPEVPSEELGPLDRAERDELAGRLRTHVDALPTDQRQVLRLVLQHGMSAVAIAEVLEVPPGTVRMRMHRGLEALRRVLPASLAGLLATSLAARGLAAVKHEVLAAGAAKAAAAAAVVAVEPMANALLGSVGTGGSAVAVGGVLVTKKLVALFVLLGIVSSWWWLGRAPASAPIDDPARVPAPAPARAELGSERAQTGDAVPVDEAARTAATPATTGEAEPGPTELWGQVVDAATKQPVHGARIDLLCRDADAFWNLDLAYGARTERLAQATSDADGRFAFAVARATPHRLRVEAAGFAPRTALACTGGSFVTIELAPGSVLTGVVRCQGEPVVGADVRIALRGENAELAVGSTDGSGAFRFVNLPAAEVLVQVASARFAEKWSNVQIAAGSAQHVEIEMEPGTALRGRVVDAATGAPIAGALVSDSWTMKRAVRTGADGRFELDGLRRRSYLLCHVRADGYVTASEDVATKLDQDLEVRLGRGGEVRGRVVGADGTPLPSAYVAVCANFMKVPGIGEADWIPARLDGDGAFVITGLRSDLHYWLMARAPGRGMRTYALPRLLADGERGELGDVVLSASAVVEGRVVDDRGAPLVGVSVTANGRNADAFRWTGGDAKVGDVSQFEGRSAKTDGSGRFRLPDLSGGRWRIVFTPRGRSEPLEQEVLLHEGEVRSGLEFVVPLGLSIAGTLVAVDGKPFVDWVQLEAIREDDATPARGSARVAPDGGFRFEGLPPGVYTLAMVVRPKGQVLAPRLHVPAGTADLRIDLEVPSFVAGKVVDAAGQPVRANVSAHPDGVQSGATFVLTEADGSFRIEVPASFHGNVHASPPDGGPGVATVENVVAGRSDLAIVMRRFGEAR